MSMEDSTPWQQIIDDTLDERRILKDKNIHIDILILSLDNIVAKLLLNKEDIMRNFGYENNGDQNDFLLNILFRYIIRKALFRNEVSIEEEIEFISEYHKINTQYETNIRNVDLYAYNIAKGLNKILKKYTRHMEYIEKNTTVDDVIRTIYRVGVYSIDDIDIITDNDVCLGTMVVKTYTNKPKA